MKVINSFDIIDTHLETAPFRIITSGIPTLHGDTMSEKMDYMRENYDWMRKRIMCEPGGQRALVAAVLTEPTIKGSDFGVFYMDDLKYQPMCGAGSLAVTKAIVELGMVPVKEPVTKVVFDTPAGLISTYAKVEDSNVLEVTLENIPSFLYAEDVKVQVEDVGEINIDIGFGGNFFALVDVEPLGFEINKSNREYMGKLAMDIIEATNKVIKVQHPVNKSIDYLDQLLFCQKPKSEGEAYVGQCVYGDCKLDDSPCGTGTSARMARMYAKGQIEMNEVFMHQNAINETPKTFKGMLLEEEKVGSFTAVVPRVTSTNTEIIGFGKLILTKDDKYKDGFLGV